MRNLKQIRKFGRILLDIWLFRLPISIDKLSFVNREDDFTKKYIITERVERFNLLKREHQLRFLVFVFSAVLKTLKNIA